MPRIPLMTLSGGRLSDFGGHKAAKVYRVWVHPKRGGDDYCYEYSTYSKALVGRMKHSKEGRVEPVCAVVYDKRYKKYREVVIDKKA